MKNFHKVRGKREFLFDDKELYVLAGGAIVICALIFVLGVMVGQSSQQQSLASPVTSDASLEEDELLLSESGIAETTPAETAEQPPKQIANAPDETKQTQRSYYQVLPDSETYVEVEATPVKRSAPESKPSPAADAVKDRVEAPVKVAKAATPVPPAAQTPAQPLPPQANAGVPSLPNVPRNPSDEIRLGRQPQPAGQAQVLPGGTIYSVQVSSSPSREDSERLVQKYGAFGYQAYVMEVDLGEKGVWYRVRVGNLPTREDADRYRKEIMTKAGSLAKDPYVIKVGD